MTLLAQLASPAALPAEEPAAPSPVSWALPGRPTRAPLPLASERPALLLAYERALELRDAREGTILWRRDLPGGGFLHAGAVPLSACDPATAWAGPAEGGPIFAIICLETGQTALTRPLPRTPNGPPLPRRGPDGVRWFVPAAKGTVLELDEAGRLDTAHVLPGPVHPPLVPLLGGVAAWTGDEPRLTPLARHRRRGLPARARPETTAVAEGCVAAASGRTVTVWNCRDRGGKVKCHRAWRQRLGADVVVPPAVDGGRLLIPSLDTFLYAFARDTGHLLYRTPAGHRLASPLALWDGRVAAVPAATAEILIFDREDGRPIATIRGEEGELFLTEPVLAAGRLFVPVLTYPGEQFLLRGYPLPEP